MFKAVTSGWWDGRLFTLTVYPVFPEASTMRTCCPSDNKLDT